MIKTIVFRTVVAVHPWRESELPNVSGTVQPVEYDCGHVREKNPIFDYKLGSKERCYTCEEEAND